MAKTVNVHEAKTHLSKLLEQVRQGEEVIIAKAGRPVARLIAVRQKPGRRKPGGAKGTLSYADDFDAPLPDEVLESFER
jgi:prevent-host-death family protein